MDVATFNTEPVGPLPCKAPWYHSGGNSCDPSWQVGYADIVRLMLEEYNDTRIVQTHFDQLCAYWAWANASVVGGIYTNYSGSFGDW